MSNLFMVNVLYASFGKGDVPTILSQLTDDVDWELWADNSVQNAGVPHFRYKKGFASVTEFFQEVAKIVDSEFNVCQANQVAAEIEIKTATYHDHEIHLWTFNEDGKVSRFRHYVDTGKHGAAADKAKNSAGA